MKRLRRWTPPWRPARHDERGDAMIIWCLGLAILLLPIGGISLDLWHVVSEERALQTAASSAANAGASGVDTATYRASHGQTVVLDPTLATSLALQNLSDQSHLPAFGQAPQVAVAAGGQQISRAAPRKRAPDPARHSGRQPAHQHHRHRFERAPDRHSDRQG